MRREGKIHSICFTRLIDSPLRTPCREYLHLVLPSRNLNFNRIIVNRIRSLITHLLPQHARALRSASLPTTIQLLVSTPPVIHDLPLNRVTWSDMIVVYAGWCAAFLSHAASPEPASLTQLPPSSGCSRREQVARGVVVEPMCGGAAVQTHSFQHLPEFVVGPCSTPISGHQHRNPTRMPSTPNSQR